MGYSNKLVRKQILKVRKFSGTEILNNQIKEENEKQLVLKITYHPSLTQLKNIKSRIHLLLTLDNEHNKVFRDVSIIGFRRAKILKDVLVRAKSPHEIRRENLNCRSKNVVYLIFCKTYHKRYTESSEEFRERFNNYKNVPRDYGQNVKVKQAFHAHLV